MEVKKQIVETILQHTRRIRRLLKKSPFNSSVLKKICRLQHQCILDLNARVKALEKKNK